MKRGHLVTVALQGDMGKPRPAVIIQSDLFPEATSLVVLPVTTVLRSASVIRLTIAPTPDNGLRAVSQVMIDKPQTVPRDKIGTVIGMLDDSAMQEINSALALFLGVI